MTTNTDKQSLIGSAVSLFFRKREKVNPPKERPKSVSQLEFFDSSHKNKKDNRDLKYGPTVYHSNLSLAKLPPTSRAHSASNLKHQTLKLGPSAASIQGKLLLNASQSSLNNQMYGSVVSGISGKGLKVTEILVGVVGENFENFWKF